MAEGLDVGPGVGGGFAVEVYTAVVGGGGEEGGEFGVGLGRSC